MEKETFSLNLTCQYLIVSNNHNMQDADHDEPRAVCYHFQTKTKEKKGCG